jgi:hypothetical protein
MKFFAVCLFAIAMSSSTTIAANQTPYFAVQNDPTDDEHFVIINKVFEAKTYCFGWDQGDRVTFVEGDPDACVDVVVYNQRVHKTCEMWCP